MSRAIRRLYHLTRPTLARLGPNSALMRLWTTWLMNLMCREFGTRVAFTPDSLDITKGRQTIRLNRNHWIMALAISKYFEVYFNCVEPKQIGDREVVDYSRPAVQKFRMSGLEFEISGYPEEEQTVLDYFRWYRPQAGETVFDVGANCGLSVYYLSECVGAEGKVYAFEPDPLNYPILLRNIERHKLANVIPVPKAVAGATGKLQFLSEGTISSTLAHQSNRATTGTVETVEAISMADACASYGVPSFVKMDIEGGEIEVLAACKEILRKNPINFAMDTNHFQNGKMTVHAVEEIFKECGYEVLSSDEAGFMTTWAKKAA